MRIPYLVSAIATTALFAALNVAAINTAIANDYAWVDELELHLKASAVTEDHEVRMSHCGKVRNSDISIALRRVWAGARARIKPPKGDTRYWLTLHVYKDMLILRKIQFVCKHKRLGSV